MTPISAIDAFSPAFQRTREILFSPLRPGRSWKLAASAYVALLGSSFPPFALTGILFAGLPIPEADKALPILAAVVLFGSLLWLLLFYLGSRMQFALFDIVLSRSQLVGPSWSKFGYRTLPYTTFKLLLGLAINLPVGLCVFIIAKAAIAGAAHLESQPHTTMPQQLIASIIAGYMLVLFSVYGSLLLFSLLNDLVLPHIALEPISTPTALQRVARLIAQEPLEFFLYLLLKVCIAIGGAIALQIAILLAMVLAVLVFGGIGALGYLLLHVALHIPQPALLPGTILLAVAAWLWIMYIAIGTYGSVLTLMQCYAMYFLGGRYPLLGNLIESPASRPFTPPPPPISDDEKDDSGPSFPMDPVPA